MDWFELLTGFREGPYEKTRAMLEVEGKQLRSLVNGKSWAIGELELVSLNALRERAGTAYGSSDRLRLSIVKGDVRKMHRAPECAGALFQVASQFNALEMTGPEVTPEDGVTRYKHDPTQGPACAIASGAATIYRNYFAPVADGIGQTADRQLDGLANIGAALSQAIGKPVADLWRMRNGYALCSRAGLEAISKYLAGLNDDELDVLRGKLSIAIQSGVEVTDGVAGPGPRVSQAFCSALLVAYTDVPSLHWLAFATLVLEAAYEATMWAAVQNANRGGSNIVLLTLLGGGAFGNEDEWILGAMRRALTTVLASDLDVRIVSYRPPSPALTKLVESSGSNDAAQPWHE
jgi:hypothetical protein